MRNIPLAPDVISHASELAPLSMGKVQVLCLKLSLDETRALPDDAALSTHEQQRLERFVHHADRLRFITGRLILRQRLATELNIAPHEVEIELVEGKPELAKKQCKKNKIQFNISHCGEMVMLAFRQAISIGIDVERLRPNHKVISIAKRVMNKKEFDDFCLLDPHQQKRAFFRLWTDKEAILKYWGTGFRTSPDSIDIGIRLERDKQWTITEQLPELALAGGQIEHDNVNYLWAVTTSNQALKGNVALYDLAMCFIDDRSP